MDKYICHKCGQPAEKGFTCDKCKKEKQLESMKRYRNKKSVPRWEFKIGINEAKIQQLTKEIEELRKKIQEVTK